MTFPRQVSSPVRQSTEPRTHQHRRSLPFLSQGVSIRIDTPDEFVPDCMAEIDFCRHQASLCHCVSLCSLFTVSGTHLDQHGGHEPVVGYDLHARRWVQNVIRDNRCPSATLPTGFLTRRRRCLPILAPCLATRLARCYCRRDRCRLLSQDRERAARSGQQTRIVPPAQGDTQTLGVDGSRQEAGVKPGKAVSMTAAASQFWIGETVACVGFG